MNDNESDWRFPKTGTPLHTLQKIFTNAAKQNIDYQKDVVLGFPGTTPLPASVTSAKRFTAAHPNHIGVHTHDEGAEDGFGGTQELERKAIYMVADLIGVANPKTEIDGCLTSGGTACNDQALWLGRERLRRTKIPSDANQGIVVLTSFLTHYSIAKNFARLFETGIPPYAQAYQRYAHRFEELETNEKGELTADIVTHAIARYFTEGFRRFLIVLNAGTINLGSIDPVADVNAAILAMQRQKEYADLCAYIHVDAAFGGFILPFLHPEVKFGFQNELVGSVGLDAHKTAYVPYPAGVFLCRKGYFDYTTLKAVYLAAGVDRTVNGSRPGTSAVALFTSLKVLGRDGFRKKIDGCMDVLRYLQIELGRFNTPGEPKNVHLYPTSMNIQTVRFSPRMLKALEKAGEVHKKLCGKEFCLPSELFPPRFHHDLAWSREMMHNGESLKVHRFVVMPTFTKKNVDTFMRCLRKALKK